MKEGESFKSRNNKSSSSSSSSNRNSHGDVVDGRKSSKRTGIEFKRIRIINGSSSRSRSKLK